MILKQELELYKYSDNFIQVYPDVATIERLKEILQLKEIVFERQQTTYDGTPESRNMTFSKDIDTVLYVEVNGIIQLPSSYTVSDDLITYDSQLNTADVISAMVSIKQDLT